MLQIENLLENIVSEYRTILCDYLTGIYLHGSLAMGCFNPNVSDIDFLVVIKRDINFEKKRQLITVLLNQEILNDIEMSIILEEDVLNFKYPTPFVLHYSKLYRDRYLKDPNFICGNSEDIDLAAHITIIYHRGRCLYGLPINQLFQEVPREYYLHSILSDIEHAGENIVSNPIYLTLNLCRVLNFLKTGAICSKKEGGEWAVHHLPNEYHDIVAQALEIYIGSKVSTEIEPKKLFDFASYLKTKIRMEVDQHELSLAR